MRDRLVAKLVWDGGNEIKLPEELGTPRDDQLKGSVGERLAEVAGRTCYDSFGQGRSSASYHEHILEVGHLSIYEHYNITFDIGGLDFEERESVFYQLVGRPGVWVVDSGLTINPRVVLDWFTLKPVFPQWVYGMLAANLYRYVPRVIKSCKTDYFLDRIEPRYPEEMWISMFLGGSRGFSHEQVRHGDFTAISQRSTRYVDESESNWVWHPLLKKYIEETNDTWLATQLVSKIEMPARAMYKEISQRLDTWCGSRKQARGAARGFLGNALYTEIIFSASVAQWNRMIAARASKAADGEIRELYQEHIIPELKKSRYRSAIKDEI